MCPHDNDLAFGMQDPRNKMIREHTDQLPLSSEPGSPNSNGATGEPSPSELLSGTVVRHHKGRTSICTGLLTRTQDLPGTFTALKREDLEGYMVTLSCVLTNTQFASMLNALSTPGNTATVDVRFEPMTPNLVPQDTAPNT